MDDPKGIPSVVLVLGPLGIMMLLWPASLMGILAFSIARRGRVRRVLGRVAVGLVVWLAGVGVIRWLDLGAVWVWIMD
jgi:hypothetical protein